MRCIRLHFVHALNIILILAAPVPGIKCLLVVDSGSGAIACVCVCALQSQPHPYGRVALNAMSHTLANFLFPLRVCADGLQCWPIGSGLKRASSRQPYRRLNAVDRPMNG